MPEMLDFEGRLERRLQAYASIPVRPVDADVVAHAVIAARRPRGLAWPVAGPRRAALVLTLLAAALLGAIAAGFLLQRDPVPPGALVVARDDGLYLAEADGSNMRLIRGGGPYREPRWARDGSRVAVIHGGGDGSEELLIVLPDGTDVGRWALPGGGSCCLIGTAEWVPSAPGGLAAIAISFDPRPGLDPGFVVDAAGTTLLERREDGGWALLDPRSRALPTIVYAGAQDDRYGIWAFDPAASVDGRARLVAERPGQAPPGLRRLDFNAIALSPDSSSVAYIASTCGFSCAGELWVTTVDGGPPVLLDDAAGAGSRLSFAADGRSLMVTLVRDERRVPHTVPLDGTAPVPLPAAAAPGTLVAWWHWSGGGTRLLGTNVGPDGAVAGERSVFATDPSARAPVRVVERALGADARPPRMNESATRTP